MPKTNKNAAYQSMRHSKKIASRASYEVENFVRSIFFTPKQFAVPGYILHEIGPNPYLHANDRNTTARTADDP